MRMDVQLLLSMVLYIVAVIAASVLIREKDVGI
jgi:hypothetical protein